MEPNLGGQRFLITHSLVQEFMGSTLVALELAKHLLDRGASVQVYASFIGEPMARSFRDQGIELVNDEGLGDVALDDYDYIWVHSQVLPVVLVQALSAELPQQMPRFVFLHMSALDYAPDEHPYIYDLERRLSSLSLFVSAEARDALEVYFDPAVTRGLLTNPAPAEFTVDQPALGQQLRRVLIVSNHRSEELAELPAALAIQGVGTDRLGAGHRFEQVTPDLLSQYDAVVTIGKTVQYSLVAGKPVYVYDHFGGYGYLNVDNFEAAAYSNFSGRGGTKKEAGEIARELRDGFAQASAFALENHPAWVERYSLPAVLDAVLEQARESTLTIEPFSPAFGAAMTSAQRFGERFYRYWGHMRDAEIARDQLRNELDVLRNQMHEDAQREVAAVRDSRSFRLGNALLRPAAAAANLTRKRKR